jgi:N utilization substance protein B
LKKAINKELNNQNKINNRSTARLIAVQALYQYYFYEQERDLDILKKELLDNYLLSEEREEESYHGKIDKGLLQKLTSNVIALIPEIDREINDFLQGQWSLEKLPDILLQIIRVANLELKLAKDTPVKVILNEYVDIAACFYDSQKVTFVNSILESLAKKNRPDEFKK